MIEATDLWATNPPWVGQLVADSEVTGTGLWAIRQQQLGKNMFIGTARGQRMRSRAGLFDQLGALLQFPDYFGENWNAFVDCIGDLEWLSGGAQSWESPSSSGQR